MSKIGKNVLIFLGLGLLALVGMGCTENTSTTSYRIASATNRPTREVLSIGTRDAEREILVMAPPRRTPTATDEAIPTETSTVEPTATEASETATATIETPEVAEETETLEPTATEESETDGEETETETPLPTATTIHADLMTLNTDRDIIVRFNLDSECYLVDHEVTGNIALRSLKDVPVYIYLKGQIRFSINNSPLLPDFPPAEPVFREDFILLQPNTEVTLLEIEDISPYIQGMGAESGIDFLASETLFGMPQGNYWVTAGYTNPHDGLTRQIDDSFLIPEAAWQGTAVSPEQRFIVVENEEDCPIED